MVKTLLLDDETNLNEKQQPVHRSIFGPAEDEEEAK